MNSEHSTKERLVEAASEIFAEKGFREATVAEICEAAEANIASVNYHFGDKSNLYRAVWEFLFKEEAIRQPIPKGFSKMGAETWLRLFIRTRIKNIFDPEFGGRLPRLIHREMGEPTEMHESLFETHLKPHHEQVKKAIKNLVGTEISEDQLRLAVLNFMSLHIFLNVGHQKTKKRKGLKNHLPSFDDPAEQARQVEAFAMGGLIETQRYLRTRRKKQ